MSRILVVVAALITVAMVAGSQIIIKSRLNAHGAVPMEAGMFVRYTLRALADWALWAALAMLVVGACIWYATLSRTPLSVAYPLISLSYPAIMLGSALFLGEHLTWHIVTANVLIVGAMVLVGMSS
ncbi:MAG: hypothetical protein J0H53_02830 [Rhizobiales bacterium]|nr:hypothetical protein [Hyphomicrobiales bacterium]